jgi:hypothetical protein
VTDCGREEEVFEALTSARWPDACSRDLSTHVAACPACADLVQVVLALTADQAAAVPTAPVPSSAVVWWRAQMRARQEAAQAASRPITVVQGIALASAIALLLATAGAALAFFKGTVPTIQTMVETARTFVPASSTEPLLTPHTVAIALLIAIWLLAAPLVAYLACADD